MKNVLPYVIIALTMASALTAMLLGKIEISGVISVPARHRASEP